MRRLDILLHPKWWSLRWRRTFLLTLPLSGPLYITIYVAVALLMVASMPFVLGAMLLSSFVAWTQGMWSQGEPNGN